MRLNVLQLDFILEKGAEDDPTVGTFTRPGEAKALSETARAVAWERVLTGRDRKALLEPRMPSEAVLEKLRGYAKYSAPTIRKVKPNAKD